jgi:chromate transport protein ChrA
MIYLDLLIGFLEVGLFSFGGAYAAIPLIRDVVLAHGWMDDEMISYMIAVSESTPGPIMVNLATYIGSNKGGLLGAVIATTAVVLPAFFIALFGAIANTLFYLKYRSLYKSEHNAILGIQARLYGAKSIVDVCVTLTLLTVVLMPSSKFSFYLDIVGSILVSAYMLRCGIMTIRENWQVLG